jgi:hypothetical protein
VEFCVRSVFESETLNRAVEIDVPESKMWKGETLRKSYFLRQGVRNVEAKVVAGLKPPFCKNWALLVVF